MAPSLADSFCLYLWRSRDLPGTLYMSSGFEATEALCRALADDGYIVKVVHAATDSEFELSAGKLARTSAAGNSVLHPRALANP